jgi:hypothetical protein
MRELDHLVVLARTLDEGAAWIESKLGVPMAPGGKHDLMGTHNRLLSLAPGRYLEVMAIDLSAPAPARPRWFELDTPEMKRRIEKGPALVHWADRTDDLEAESAAYPDSLEIVPFQRGAFRWRMALRPDGRFPAEGKLPTLIQWEGTLHPANELPASGCTLERFETASGSLVATFRTPSGTVTISRE